MMSRNTLSKPWRASKLHHWFKSNRNFAKWAGGREGWEGLLSTGLHRLVYIVSYNLHCTCSLNFILSFTPNSIVYVVHCKFLHYNYNLHCALPFTLCSAVYTVYYNLFCTLPFTLYTEMSTVQFHIYCKMPFTLHTAISIVHYNLHCKLQLYAVH